MINSKDKGKRGERQWRDKLREHGFQAWRGIQYQGGPDSPDVVCKALSGFHFEVKYTNRLRINEAYKQACVDAKGGKIPVLAHRSNRDSWLITLNSDDFLMILRRSDLIDASL